MDWTLLLFLWFNVAGIVALVVWLCRSTQREIKEAQRAQGELIEQHKNLVAEALDGTRNFLSHMREGQNKLLAHDAAMQQMQAEQLHSALSTLTVQGNAMVIKLMQTFLVAQSKPGGRSIDQKTLLATLERISSQAVNFSGPPTNGDSRLQPEPTIPPTRM